MKSRRRTAVAPFFALLVAIGLGITACSGGAAKSSGQPAPKDALVASVDDLATTSYDVSLAARGVTAVGSIDPVEKTATVNATLTTDSGHAAGTINVLMIATDTWAKMDLGTENTGKNIDPQSWMKLDPSRMSPDSLPFDASDLNNAFNLHDLLSATSGVTRVDVEDYTGTIDLTAVRTASTILPSGAGLPPAAKSVAFMAKLDGQGRLTDFSVGGATSGDTGITTDYAFDFGISDYSGAPAVLRPTDNETVEAPTTVYALLKSE